MLASHRRRIVICITALLTLFGFELGVRHMEPQLRAYDEAVYRRTFENLTAADQPEIVIMGSSRAGYALDPDVVQRITGRRAFNAYIPATKVVEWTILARRMLNTFKPRLVILGVNASEVRADYAPLEAALHAFDWPDMLESIQLDGISVDVVGAYLQRAIAPAFRTYARRYELSLWGSERLAAIFPTHAQAAREQRHRATRPYPANGYRHPWLYGRQLKTLSERIQAQGAKPKFASCPDFDPESSTFERFARLLNEFRHAGIAVVVAYMPNSPGTESRWSATEPHLKAAIARACEEAHTPFLNWPLTDLPRTDDDYVHEGHVGLPLGREITARIARFIQSHALLDSERPIETSGRRLAATEEQP